MCHNVIGPLATWARTRYAKASKRDRCADSFTWEVSDGTGQSRRHLVRLTAGAGVELANTAAGDAPARGADARGVEARGVEARGIRRHQWRWPQEDDAERCWPEEDDGPQEHRTQDDDEEDDRAEGHRTQDDEEEDDGPEEDHGPEKDAAAEDGRAEEDDPPQVAQLATWKGAAPSPERLLLHHRRVRRHLPHALRRCQVLVALAAAHPGLTPVVRLFRPPAQFAGGLLFALPLAHTTP